MRIRVAIGPGAAATRDDYVDSVNRQVVIVIAIICRRQVNLPTVVIASGTCIVLPNHGCVGAAIEDVGERARADIYTTSIPIVDHAGFRPVTHLVDICLGEPERAEDAVVDSGNADVVGPAPDLGHSSLHLLAATIAIS